MQSLFDYLPLFRRSGRCLPPSAHGKHEYVCKEVAEKSYPGSQVMEAIVRFFVGGSDESVSARTYIDREEEYVRSQSSYVYAFHVVNYESLTSNLALYLKKILHLRNQRRRPLSKAEVLDTPENIVRHVRHAVHDTYEGAKDTVGHGYQNVKDGLHSVKDKVEDIYEGAKAKASDVGHTVSETAFSAKNRAGDVVDDVVGRVEEISEDACQKTAGFAREAKEAGFKAKDKAGETFETTNEKLGMAVKETRDKTAQCARVAEDVGATAKEKVGGFYESTRERLRDYKNEASGGAERAYDNVVPRADDIYGGAKDLTEEYSTKLNHGVRNAYESLGDYAHQIMAGPLRSQQQQPRLYPNQMLPSSDKHSNVFISGFYAAILAAYWVILFFRMFSERAKTRVWLGDGSRQEFASVMASETKGTPAGTDHFNFLHQLREFLFIALPVTDKRYLPLQKTIEALRSYSNIVPLALILLGMCGTLYWRKNSNLPSLRIFGVQSVSSLGPSHIVRRLHCKPRHVC